MNEPKKYNTDHATFLAFGDWLRQKCGSLEALNRRWFRQFSNFSEVTVTPEMLTGGNYGWLDYRPIVDWREFNIDNLVHVLLWIKSQVLLYDTAHPTHINVTDPLGGPTGQDAWKEQRTVDILGASVHPAWMFPPAAARSAYGELFAYHLDLIGGPSGNKPWWVTELQGGPTIFTGKFPFNSRLREAWQCSRAAMDRRCGANSYCQARRTARDRIGAHLLSRPGAQFRVRRCPFQLGPRMSGSQSPSAGVAQ